MEESELLAILEGLKGALKEGCSRLCIQLDSKLCINAIKNQKSILHWSLKEIVKLVQDVSSFFVSA